MFQSQWEIIILKPTASFLSFLAAQLPNCQLPELSLLQQDCSSFLIAKKSSDEETLAEIEHHFPTMFRYEINRWLGKQTSRISEMSFLDFLCCFKFELHSKIILLETSIDQAYQMICIKPRTVLLKWIENNLNEEEDAYTTTIHPKTLIDLTENATVIIKNFDKLGDIKPFLLANYNKIFKQEMQKLAADSDEWPEVYSFQDFNRYFYIEVHTQLISLLKE